jgi:hypothetical protein
MMLWLVGRSLHEHHAIPRGGCDGFMKSFCGHCMFTCYWMNFSRPDNRFVSVPNPSVYHWRPDLPQLPWADPPSRRRNLTAVYLGSTLTMTAAHTKIRRAVVRAMPCHIMPLNTAYFNLIAPTTPRLGCC